MRTWGQDKGVAFCGASLCLGPVLKPFLQLIQWELGGHLAAGDQSLGRAQRQGLSVTWGHPRSGLHTTRLCPPLPLCRGAPAPKVVPLQPHLLPTNSLPFVLCRVSRLGPSSSCTPKPPHQARFAMMSPCHRERKCGDGNPSYHPPQARTFCKAFTGWRQHCYFLCTEAQTRQRGQ